MPVSAAADVLSLGDWRRRIATLYAEVRATARQDPEAAWEHWRTVRAALYRTHPESPVPPAERSAFEARHFAYDPALRFESVEVRPSAAGEPGDEQALALPNSGSEELAFRRIGTIDVPFPEGSRTLAVFWMLGYAGGLFLPFRDATNGRETYGAGRYVLDAAKSADLGGDANRTLVVDFNFAYQPSCAFDPRWACPLAPPENWLDLPVRAGERLS